MSGRDWLWAFDLMAADHLLHDIKRVRGGYLDRNKQEYELTKHVSLAMLDPMALVQLKETGECAINLPEAVFDMDHPGHYRRRLKSVSISIARVAGPHTSVNWKLPLVSSKYRKNTALIAGAATDRDKYIEATGNDERFVYHVETGQSVATSHVQNDSGVFELDFRDERYLPFEGAGAISTWQLEMPRAFKQFDYSTISDVIIHLRYSALDGGKGFKAVVESALRELVNELLLSESGTGFFKAFNIKHEFPSEWHILKQANSVSFALTDQHLPLFVQGHSSSVDSTIWVARVKDNPAIFVMSLDGTTFDLNRDPHVNNLCVGSSDPITLGAAFTLSAASTADLEELVLIIKYTLNG